ncbi:MAG: class I SAM-dependent methyltransferase [Actinomycetota bacterium]|nr:class I SAM-dependent methyltransferase [Actinomycetota bacterium]
MPGLVIAVARPDLHVRLLDRSTRRVDGLQRMIARLGLDSRVEAICTDVAMYECTEPADAVVARSLAPPAETLRHARRLVVDEARGRIVISDPPTGERWPASLLDSLRVRRVEVVEVEGEVPPGAGRVAVFACFT